MMKKIVLLLMVVINLGLANIPVLANENYSQTFFINALQKQIERNWLRPLNDAGKSTVVYLTANPDGTVSNVNLLRSSGNDQFDASTIDSVYKAFPFAQATTLEAPLNIEFFFSPIFTTANAVSDKIQSNIVNVSNKSPYINFSDYTDTLQNRINANWKPKQSRKERSAIATVKIGNDGALENFYLVKSSRNRKFDRSVIDSITSSVPMDAFPQGIDAPNTDVQISFNVDHSKLQDKTVINNKYVIANVMNIKGYDKYTKLAERILAESFRGKRCLFYKDLVVELRINKVGKLKYVKIKKASKDKRFDRKMLAILRKTSFPPIPETIPFNDVVLNYEIVTGRFGLITPFCLTDEQF